MRRPRAGPLACSLVLAAACGRAPVAGPGPARPLDAVVVATMDLGYPPSPYEAALRTEDLLGVLWERSEWAVLTAAEVRLRPERGASLRAASDLDLHATELGVDPRRVALLRSAATLVPAGDGSLAEAAARARDDCSSPPHGTKAPRSGEDAAGLLVTLALCDAEGRPLVEVTELAVLDPFAEHPASDHRPELRAAIAGATARLVALCEDCFRRVGRLPYAVRASPAAVLAREGAAGSLPRRDEMDRFADVLTALHYLEPELTASEAERLLGLGTGACLVGDGPGGLVAGDCIVAADGRPIDGPHALLRALSRPGVRLEVVPAGATERLSRPYAP